MSYYCMVHLWKNIGNSLYNQSEHQYDNNTKTTTDTHDYSLLAFFIRLRMVKNKQKPFHHIKIDQVLKFHVMFYSRDRAHPYFYCYQISGTHRVWERTSKRATVSNCTLYIVQSLFESGNMYCVPMPWPWFNLFSFLIVVDWKMVYNKKVHVMCLLASLLHLPWMWKYWLKNRYAVVPLDFAVHVIFNFYFCRFSCALFVRIFWILLMMA